MVHSIQEYCKKINRAIGYRLLFALSVTTGILLGTYLYMYFLIQERKQDVVYREVQKDVGGTEVLTQKGKIQPFGSKHGKTYTFLWCQGSQRILEKNKVYFRNEDEAKRSGRTLSKLCSK